MSIHQKILSGLLLTAFLFIHINAASAQSVNVIGEVKASGKVFIESSSGQWLPAPATYPLLQNTGIKTDDGSASIFFKDGSRVDIAKNSIALVDGSASQYSIQLNKGIVAFNITASSSLTVQTPSASISANRSSSLVQKVSIEKSGRVLGVISATEKGTEIRSISGRIMVDITPSEAKLISTGESIFIDTNSKYNVYKTQAVSQGSTAPSPVVAGASGETIGQVVVVGVFVTAVTVGAFDAFRAGSGVASPSGF
jgi:hypothetical protein